MPPLLTIDLASNVPAYRQIVDALRARLVDGALQPGDSLPPVRQLALDLGIHFNTVAQAYRILAQEGWLDLRRRRGALILARPDPEVQDEAKLGSLRRRLHEITTQLRAEGMSPSEIAGELRLLAEGIEQ